MGWLIFINTYIYEVSSKITKMDSENDFEQLRKDHEAAFRVCARFFEDQVHPLLTSSLPDLQIEYRQGLHCARVYFGRSRVYEGTRYDGISISVAPDRCGNRLRDYGRSENFIPSCIEGLLLIEDSLQNRSELFEWNLIEDMIREVKSLSGE